MGKLTIPNGNGAFVLHGYDTERDLKKAKSDIERFCIVLAQMSLYEQVKFLAPYRVKAARDTQEEYDELTEKARKEAEL